MGLLFFEKDTIERKERMKLKIIELIVYMCLCFENLFCFFMILKHFYHQNLFAKFHFINFFILIYFVLLTIKRKKCPRQHQLYVFCFVLYLVLHLILFLMTEQVTMIPMINHQIIRFLVKNWFLFNNDMFDAIIVLSKVSM